MEQSAFAKMCVSVALFAIMALATLAIGRSALAHDGTMDPFHGASYMPGDPANTWPAPNAERGGVR